jgi:CheY-like chemotaxis protein
LARWLTSNSLPFADTIKFSGKGVKPQFHGGFCEKGMRDFGLHGRGPRKIFAILPRTFHSWRMTQPLAFVVYERLLPGSQLVNRLQDLKYRVHAVTDVEALVPCAQQEKPMLVLADLVSSRHNVCQAIQRLRKDPETQHIPVIAFGPDDSADLQNSAREAGATLIASEAAVLNHLTQILDQALQVE